ncbi:MAG TPA: hypothetical protein VMW11_05735 [Candidatus Dormibacteraeota bacterium]|nr:hypothetical protein [Candidatus Dormibacteraeota bacterium]
MTSGSLLKVTVTICAVLAAVVAVAAALLGHASLGMGLAAGLLLGSLNGYLIQSLLGRGTPFVAGSLLRLVMFSAVAIGAALLLRGVGWTVPLGIGVAQLVMVGAGVRQGLRA